MHGIVTSTTRLTPSLVRIVLGGEGLAGFTMPDATDAYVNVAIAPPGASYGGLFDPDEVKADLPREQWPARRRYTVRSWNAAAGLLTIDFVVHGTEGVAGPWAASARPGDVLVLTGPGSGYRPDPEAAWHLLAGDESALPAIAASLEDLAVTAPEARVAVVLVCDGPEHELALTGAPGAEVTWVHRTAGRPSPLPEAVEAATGTLPEGRGQAFIHGEADEVRAVRRHLLGTLGMTRAEMSCSPYWRRTMTDEAWRAVKREYVAAMDADVPA